MRIWRTTACPPLPFTPYIYLYNSIHIEDIKRQCVSYMQLFLHSVAVGRYRLVCFESYWEAFVRLTVSGVYLSGHQESADCNLSVTIIINIVMILSGISGHLTTSKSHSWRLHLTASGWQILIKESMKPLLHYCTLSPLLSGRRDR